MNSDPKISESTELLATKTVEYDKLPGHILGLDGWILKTVDPEFRAQFLTGYEKLLKIVFHPDRVQVEAQKRTREMFLQNVSEAVRYMLSDAFAYEMTMDTVPSKKNPMLQLREQITMRDTIISRIDGELKQKSDLSDNLRRKAEAQRTRFAKHEFQLERKFNMLARLRSAERRIVRGFPVPVGSKSAVVTGFFLDFHVKAGVTSSMGHYASEGQLHSNHEWVHPVRPAWAAEAKSQGVASGSKTLVFRNRISQSDDGGTSYTMVGAMSMIHLCEFIREQLDFPDKRVPPEEIVRVLEHLSCLRANTSDEDESISGNLSPFMLQYYGPDIMLVLRVIDVRKKIKPEARNPNKIVLFLVRNVDAGLNPEKARADGFEREIRRLNAKILSQANKIREMEHELGWDKKKRKLLPTLSPPTKA